MAFLSEAAVEQALLDQLRALDYSIEREEDIGPDGHRPERESHDGVVLKKRFEDAVARLNPGLPLEARQDAARRVMQSELPSLLEENRRIHKLMIEGVDVEYYADDGTLTAGKVALINFEQPEQNDWLAVSQFVVVAGHYNRRPDVVVFVNGLPLGVVELKAPGSGNATLVGAFNQLQTYKKQIPALFNTNALLVTSDGITARVGSLSADLERFMPWRTTDGTDVAPKGAPELSTLIEGVFEHRRLLDLLCHFTAFGETGSGLAKVIAGYHQFHAVRHAVNSTVAASSPEGNKRVGVIWHTQGSGKSLLMAFYAGQLVKHPAMANPTLVVLTDRNDLDDQLFSTFSMCRDLIRQTPVQAESREDLQKVLSRASGGVIFTTLQKFGELAEPLTTRRNVVVIADEAHRSQYGFKAKVDTKTGEISYGFAKYMRDALPNASFIGFTGTPIEADDVNTPAVFGNYIDVYDISRAVEDGATVPIYYESRLARIELDEDEKPKIDAEVEDLTEEDSEADQERFKKKWSTVETLVGSDKRLALVAKDMVAHFDDRVAALDGKAMVVCMSRRICVKLYDEIVKLRPDWHSADDNAGAIKIVMTGAASDPQEWQQHIGNKARRDQLAKRARDPKDPLKLVIVRDMWLTGFDAPCMHTMYVDKPMHGHGLMQAIARVNRVFRDKPAGLIVDYIGIAQNLKSALQQYSKNDQDNTGVDEAQAIAVMMEKYEVVRDMYHGFDYASALTGTPQERLAMMAGAIEWLLDLQQRLAAKEKTEGGKKNAHRRYQDAVLALSKAYSLASASDEAREIREEVGFFQAIRAALVKSATGSGVTEQERELAIQQIVSRAVVSTEIVDILAAAGIKSPDISILSDEFLAEVQRMERKNLALEALRKLINDGIRSRSKANVVQTRAFSERLEDAVARYHANAITTAEVLQELIKLAKDIRAARKRGEESGLSDEEIAFYDALAENDSAVQMMGDDKLRLIAHELLVSLRENVSVDWAHRESARARMRVLVKRILRKYGYPPDLQYSAVQTVLQQAEALSSGWVFSRGGATSHGD
ncbi:type I site-specific deoxyribonuclease, HsdR family protein [Burkholderia thailandensis E264]|uniref:Type I restriction enzyme endonuclease subunit n=1 Tax=Burkholderia thailandensis (strain ATCC 700388 / DSM 13276 / CCUG 48851 / CIP 106301 / E264) TaxID=271848 RepID=Q2SUZ5_BURTA|nr:type I restriction endonuclease subunit R [Burkholderia thailandensis]ABC39354.1 type I restriction-modification system endonuclease XF2739 [Burkholderia thailandensis E264]AHI73767.1 type I site-specific deoxyribonuclease, HsdR family protein [Burkholderia thailandensis 2002721723]AIP26429.1 type I site-specific deoxyribonuclease, HsdR family protein [Burkholderia thailandensis E264]AJY00317.1 type I site-specific deoxyribonuclease, HsdR family protein [Burkholderia thailandensis 2002721643